MLETHSSFHSCPSVRPVPSSALPVTSDRSRYAVDCFLILSGTMSPPQRTEPGVDHQEDGLLREGDGYDTVLLCQLGSHSIVMGGEVKAVDPSVECKLGSTAGYVEFKTNHVLSTEWHQRRFHEHKLLRWWALSRLGGVPKGFCGFRDDNGIVLDIQRFDVLNMPGMAKGLWSEEVCMRFCNQLLSFIKEHVEGNDGRTVYHFEYVPSSREIVCKRLTNPTKLYRLPDWFLEAFEDC
ncbi:hypothetical protein HPB49_021258 [Dermacentor silvarum]|uniref:Uncharacterized protein n=1 Tax=Dermacentor silvarum TaxID=543639 RepID=A0ACB8CB89_DERSI|nr:hypothetical protein HPB49_021258 [Dermacentor silvarum]